MVIHLTLDTVSYIYNMYTVQHIMLYIDVACVKHNENWYCCDDQSCFKVTEDEMDVSKSCIIKIKIIMSI